MLPFYFVASSLVGPNILLSTQFSNTLNLCSSLSVRDQVWIFVPHKYKKGISVRNAFYRLTIRRNGDTADFLHYIGRMHRAENPHQWTFWIETIDAFGSLIYKPSQPQHTNGGI
jgi:hypothetical protein